MLQDSSQNDIVSREKLDVWLKWLAKNTASVQDTTDIASDKEAADIEVPDSVLEMLRCIIALPTLSGPAVMRQDKVKQCIDKVSKNQDDFALFFTRLQESPSAIIPLMQKLGRPLPLPLKDLIRAMEEVAKDTTSASDELRRSLFLYFSLLKKQQGKLISLMQDSASIVSECKSSRSDKDNVKNFIDDWVQVFESKFVQYAQEEEYSKELGELINASVQVLKEQKIYRDYLRSK